MIHFSSFLNIYIIGTSLIVSVYSFNLGEEWIVISLAFIVFALIRIMIKWKKRNFEKKIRLNNYKYFGS